LKAPTCAFDLLLDALDKSGNGDEIELGVKHGGDRFNLKLSTVAVMELTHERPVQISHIRG